MQQDELVLNCRKISISNLVLALNRSGQQLAFLASLSIVAASRTLLHFTYAFIQTGRSPTYFLWVSCRDDIVCPVPSCRCVPAGTLRPAVPQKCGDTRAGGDRLTGRREKISPGRSVPSILFGTLHWILRGKTTRCEKGLRENQNRTSPRRRSRTTSRRAGCSALKMSTGFCSPGNARP